MSPIADRQTIENAGRRCANSATRGRGAILGFGALVMAGMLAWTGGGFAADKRVKTVKTEVAALAPINLAGRWSGPRYSHNLIASDEQACGGKSCDLTYDIVACPEGWCGIAVTEATPCGAIGLKLSTEHPKNRPNAFMGKLELAKGSAPYTVEAWHHSGAASGSPAGSDHLEVPLRGQPAAVAEADSNQTLNFVGDTGPELLLMRRSFPFHAELARVGDATCTLEKATS
jgi:hypothetical protein